MEKTKHQRRTYYYSLESYLESGSTEIADYVTHPFTVVKDCTYEHAEKSLALPTFQCIKLANFFFFCKNLFGP